jgi:response regulator RpfG family c-di-GMP phosphodiesterase
VKRLGKSYKILFLSKDRDLKRDIRNIFKQVSEIGSQKYDLISAMSGEEISPLSKKHGEFEISLVDISLLKEEQFFNNLLEISNGLRERFRPIFILKDRDTSMFEKIFEFEAIDIFKAPFCKEEIAFKMKKHLIESRALQKEHMRTLRQLDKVTSISDKREKELRALNEELNDYKKELEKKIEEAIFEIKNLNLEIEDTQREVVFTMGAIGESRSKETGNHVKRVAEYSYLLAKKYGLPEKKCELIKQASPMHDIGKVAIPDAILNKPGRFTDEEFILMQKHAELGYEMLKHSQRELLKVASLVAFEHHEKWNGRGYPRGLKEDEISIEGRITAIADVFDALGSDRVYKKAWELERILKLFKDERGEHFDPLLIDIFFDNLDEILSIRDKFID